MSEEQTQEMTPSSDIAARAQSQETVFSIPDEYKDAGWAKDIKSSDDLWKMNANAQSLIGKRPAGIPSNDAGKEEWEKFYNTLGRPEEPSAYKFSEIEGLPEGVDLTPHTEKFAEFAHKHGLTQKQADALRQDWLQYELSTQSANSEELDKTFDKIKSEHFGDDFDKLQADAVAFIDGKLPEEMDAHVRQAFTNDPITQGAFIKLIESMNTQIADLKKEYGAEGNLGSGQQSSGRSLDDIRADLAKLNTSEANRNFDHPEHKTTRQKIEALRGELQRALK